MEGGREEKREGGKEGGEVIAVEESMHTLRVTFTLLLCVNVHGRTLFSLLSLLLQ